MRPIIVLPGDIGELAIVEVGMRKADIVKDAIGKLAIKENAFT